ncbi:hypothetical protein [Nocardioides stalactiti]|uniref:hypothetical protein n=1 Tax=Nocardioides stalactiti TaxID=2755356 RepID=UPI0015FF1A10|nr:hypothetical protein [Nocardioides stalactiti]
MRWPSRAALGAVALSVALLPSTAEADRWTGGDAEGDVRGWHYSPEPKPCGTDTVVNGSAEVTNDITGLEVRHTRRSLVMTTTFRDLDPDLEVMVTNYVRTPRGGYWLDLVRFQRPNGTWRVLTFLSKAPRYPDPDQVNECGAFGFVSTGLRCRIGREIDPVGDVVRLTLPRTCLQSPDWVRVGADAVRFVETDDPDDETFTVFSDDFDGGTVLTKWKISYGPRVHSTGVVGPSGDMEPLRTRSTARRFKVVDGTRQFAHR